MAVIRGFDDPDCRAPAMDPQQTSDTFPAEYSITATSMSRLA
jgi:hypothetical protein